MHGRTCIDLREIDEGPDEIGGWTIKVDEATTILPAGTTNHNI